jgi:hypothetical protein
MSLGERAAAEQRLTQARRILEPSPDPDPRLLAACLSNLGSLYRREGKLDEAEPLLGSAVEIQLESAGPRDPDTAGYLHNLNNPAVVMRQAWWGEAAREPGLVTRHAAARPCGPAIRRCPLRGRPSGSACDCEWR